MGLTIAVLVVLIVFKYTGSHSATLACSLEPGPGTPPADMTVKNVDVRQHGSVTVLAIRFNGDIPARADPGGAGGKVGDDIAFLVSDGDTKAFTNIGSDPSGKYGFMSFAEPFTNTNNVVQDGNTYVRTPDPRTIVVSLDAKAFALGNRTIDPKLVVQTNHFTGNPYSFTGYDDQTCTA
jgi:hypothetical protein